jgi:GntR family transcriptional regulator
MKDPAASTPWRHWAAISSPGPISDPRRAAQAARRLRPANGDQRLPLYQLLRDDLAAKIASGTWKYGVALPSEAALAESYGVSIGTMRHAIEELVRDGMLERRQGSGTFLRRPDFTSSLFRFFLFQPPEGGEWLPESRILRRETEPSSAEVAAQLGLAPGDMVIHLLRQRLFNGEPFAIENIWLSHDRFRALLELPQEETGPLLYPIYESVCGQMVAAIEETLTISSADPEQAEFLRIAPQTPVVVIQRLARSHNGTLLEYRRSCGRGDRFSYKIEVR